MLKQNDIVKSMSRLSDISLLTVIRKYIRKIIFRIRKQGLAFQVKLFAVQITVYMKNLSMNNKLKSNSCQYQEYINIYKGKPLQEKPVKVIAFYTPWDAIFSEEEYYRNENLIGWKNGMLSQMNSSNQFQHYMQDKFESYKLFDAKAQLRQVELAKTYGLSGFCYLFIWRGGKLLFETPLFQHLNDESLDFPFCLCMVKEKQDNFLKEDSDQENITKEYSPGEDLIFIKQISKYFKDKRYICINGKPLLLINNPDQFLFPQKELSCWRDWCFTNGIGAIYLACIKSTENQITGDYGFDGVISIPSMNMHHQGSTEKLVNLNNITDCTNNISNNPNARGNNQSKPNYVLYHGLPFPWSVPRMVNKGREKDHQNLTGIYHKLLCNAIDSTLDRFSDPDRQLLFVDLWNRWTSGANLNPDKRYGYAYHEATRMALVRRNPLPKPANAKIENSIAIVIHAFYIDIFKEILGYLDKIDFPSLSLYITTTHDQYDYIDQILIDKPYEYKLLSVNNRGRDILPFLEIIPEVKQDGCSYFIKVHTKKSPHRVDGNTWREDLFEKVLKEKTIIKALSYFNDNPSIGIIGPKGHVLPMSYKWPSNAIRVKRLAMRMGVMEDELRRLKYPAGSMFIARINAIDPLMSLALDDEDFEPEAGQFDGTLAHCMERIFAVSAFSQGLKTINLPTII